MTFTAREKYDDAVREVKLRERVYARMVNVGDMTKELAAKRIAIMTEIASEYKRLMQQEDLFREDPVPLARHKADRRDRRASSGAGPDHAGEPGHETAAADSERPDTPQAD